MEAQILQLLIKESILILQMLSLLMIAFAVIERDGDAVDFSFDLSLNERYSFRVQFMSVYGKWYSERQRIEAFLAVFQQTVTQEVVAGWTSPFESSRY